VGLIVDTGVFIRLEREPQAVDFSLYSERYADAYVSAGTASELLLGVHLANTEARRLKRTAFVEAVLRLYPVLPFDLEVARIHSRLVASLPRNVTLGSMDLILGATALRHGFAVLTTNPDDFRRMPGCMVEAVPAQ
jgi:predicted nucleic acid-binding protein